MKNDFQRRKKEEKNIYMKRIKMTFYKLKNAFIYLYAIEMSVWRKEKCKKFISNFKNTSNISRVFIRYDVLRNDRKHIRRVNYYKSVWEVFYRKKKKQLELVYTKNFWLYLMVSFWTSL